MSPRFQLVEPEISPVVGSSSLYAVREDFRLLISAELTLTIRAGFRFDGGSVPRFAWSIVGHPFSGKCLVAYLAHDAGYAGHLASRETVDEWLSVLLRRYNVAAVRRGLIWSAVRCFGGFAWDAHTPQSVTAARKLVSLSVSPA